MKTKSFIIFLIAATIFLGTTLKANLKEKITQADIIIFKLDESIQERFLNLPCCPLGHDERTLNYIKGNNNFYGAQRYALLLNKYLNQSYLKYKSTQQQKKILLFTLKVSYLNLCRTIEHLYSQNYGKKTYLKLMGKNPQITRERNSFAKKIELKKSYNSVTQLNNMISEYYNYYFDRDPRNFPDFY